MPVSNGFTYTESGGNATITAYDPTVSDQAYAPTIPTTLDTYPVIAIGTSAFASKSLTAVTFNHALNVGDLAFDNNSGIDITINANLTTTTIGSTTDVPFYRCSVAAGLTIGASCTAIAQRLFCNCGLTALTIPSTCTVINDYAFAGNSIAAVTFSNAVQLGQRCFQSNSGIDVTLSANITTSVNTSFPFESCNIADGLTISEGVTAIPAHLFRAAGLTSLTIPSTVTVINTYAFATNSIASLTFDNAITLYDACFASNGAIAVTINVNVAINYVTTSPFNACSIGNGLTIGASCGIVNNFLFRNAGITSLTIPSTCTEIKQSAFSTNSIASLTFGNTVKLYTTAFEANGSISITLNTNLTTSCVTNGPFKDCTIGNNLTIQSGCTDIPDYLFRSSGLTSLTIPASVTTIGSYAFRSNAGITSLTVPSTCTEIKQEAFSYNAIASLTFNSTVLLRTQAFSYNTGITITLNTNLTTNCITDGPFKGCNIGSGLTIQGGCTTVPSYLFQGSGLTALTLPASVTLIEEYAFKLNSIVSVAFNNVVDLKANCFASDTGITLAINANITCTTLILTTQAPFLSCALAGGVTIQSGCTNVPKYLFVESGLTEIEFHNAVTNVGNYCLYDNDNLTKITVRKTDTAFGTNILDGSTPVGGGSIYGWTGSTAQTWAGGYVANYTFYPFSLGSGKSQLPTRRVKSRRLMVYRRRMA